MAPPGGKGKRTKTRNADDSLQPKMTDVFEKKSDNAYKPGSGPKKKKVQNRFPLRNIQLGPPRQPAPTDADVEVINLAFNEDLDTAQEPKH